MRNLRDRFLVGHALAQRYLHPTAYRSKFAELRAWMRDYADHPDARRIYRLALRRTPEGAAAPNPPLLHGAAAGSGKEAAARARPSPPPKPLTAAERRKRGSYRKVILDRVRRGWPTGALRVLEQEGVARLYGRLEQDELRTRIAAGYFRAGKNEQAHALASRAADRSGEDLPRSRWFAGFAGFRIARFDEAARHFEALAHSPVAPERLVAKGAYWAARAYLAAGRPYRADHMLGIAARRTHTFYGLLARRTLGLPTEFDWNLPRLAEADLTRLGAEPAARRAFALLQVGEKLRAERELIGLQARASPELARALLALADHVPLPALSVRVGYRLSAADGTPYHGAVYPVPDWEPEEGFRLDRALLFAFVRQESGFNARAKSLSGARGLMQLMPGTAAFVAGKGFRGHERERLFDPRLNLSLGQRYLGYLIEAETIRGNLLLAAAAYNGGPGNLARWRRELAFDGDPLLFLESIPSEETRLFVEKVLANLWIYRERLGQPAPSLEQLAAGDWPVYIPLDRHDLRIAASGQDRREPTLRSRQHRGADGIRHAR